VNPVEYLRAIRRRWLDVALAVLVALGAGFLISSVAPPAPKLTSYEATSVLLAGGNFFDPNAPSLEALAELTVVGEVPVRAASRLDYEGNPADIAALVQTSVNPEAGILRIKVTSTDAELSRDYSDAFARALVAYLRDLQAGTVAEASTAILRELEETKEEIRSYEQRIASASGAERIVLTAERDGLISDYSLRYQSYLQLANSSNDPVNLDIIQAPTPREVSTGGFEPPRSRTGILVLAGILGLLAGVIIVLVLDRFDNRIRTRQVAEKHFGFPVLAEIPYVPRFRRRTDEIRSLSEPRSSTADAYRIIATMLSMPRDLPGATTGNGNGRGDLPYPPPMPAGTPAVPRRILITSPGPSDGKTTVAANLAAVFGGRGDLTTVFSCDLRRPYIHRLFGVGSTPGLSEALTTPGTAKVPIIDSPVAPNVSVVPSGAPPEQPGEILGSPLMLRTFEAMQGQADVIVIDTAPVLSTSDAAPLMDDVDAVLIVARAGRTTAEVAERTSEMLRRLNAPVVGVILNAAVEMNVPRRYYSYRYYRRPPEHKQRRGIPLLSRHRSGT
jgi:capsular exopolysaccharide synthesis family protein